MPPTLQPLTSVALGATATVAEIKLPPESRPRLMEMGLLVGTTVELVRFAPLGDPVEIKVRGYHLTLRKHEAEQILVQANALSLGSMNPSQRPGAAGLARRGRLRRRLRHGRLRRPDQPPKPDPPPPALHRSDRQSELAARRLCSTP